MLWICVYRDRQFVSRSVLKDFTDYILTISTGRELHKCWMRIGNGGLLVEL